MECQIKKEDNIKQGRASGNLYVVAAPSGTGKTTLVKALVNSLPDITVSISHTTRPKRPAEIQNIHYHFIDEAEFQRMIKNDEFLEYARVFNYFYGTSKQFVETTLASGLDVILEIDWQGCQQIQTLFPESISIFILPPSIEILHQRLRDRSQDRPNIIEQRIADVRKTLSHITEYDYIVMNDHFEKAVEELKVIVQAGRLLEKQQSRNFSHVLEALKQ